MYSYNFKGGTLANPLEAKAKGNRDRREVELEPSPLFRRQQQTTPNITCAGKMPIFNYNPVHSS